MQGRIYGEGAGGAQPLPPGMKPSSSYSLLKFVYLTAFRSVTSFLRGAPPPKENPGSAPDMAAQNNRPLMG